MKHLKLLPLLIGAASYLPRAHAADVVQTTELSAWSMVLIGLSLIVLSLASHRRPPVIKPEQ